MLYLSPALVLAPAAYAGLANPVFCWRNVVDVASVAADSEDADYPAVNLANPQTSSVWKSETTDEQYITVAVASDEPVDYVGVARHNFGSGQIAVAVEVKTAEPGAAWEEVASLVPGDDSPLLIMLEAGFYIGVRLKLTPDEVPPQAAVLQVGKALIMPRSTPAGFVPLPDALERETLTGIAENGDFLGDIVTSERLSTTVSFQLLGGDWYRESMRPFVQAGAPFFYCWSPAQYPGEAGFAKFEAVPQGEVNQWRGEMDVTLKLIGLAL